MANTTLIVKKITIKQADKFVSDADSEALCDAVSDALDHIDWEGIVKSQVLSKLADRISVKVEE